MTGWVLVALACTGGPSPDASAVPTGPAPVVDGKVAASEILIRFHGSAGPASEVNRTDEEARTLAVDLWGRINAGESLEVLARQHSDGPAAPRGGRLGVWRLGTMVPEVEQAVTALAIGETALPVRTPFGWHIVRRDAVVEIAVRHVLITWSGAWRSTSTRTREAARAQADQAARRLQAGEPFSRVAAELSDDATAKSGGDLGVIAPGQLVPAFEDAAFALAPGQRSSVVETPYGFHVIERLR
jgi:parvulin-like peptidyl-prolyl isomerase